MTNATTPSASKDWPMALNDFACGIAFPRIPALKKLLIVFRGSAFHNLANPSDYQSAFPTCRTPSARIFAKAVSAHLLRVYEERAERVDQAESEMKQS